MPTALAIPARWIRWRPVCCRSALAKRLSFSQYLLDSDKRYRVIAKLGQRTDTSDADGRGGGTPANL